MANAKEIKARIKSIKNTQKTTKAMELVSGAKMRKAVQAATGSRAYHSAAWTIANRLRKNAGSDVDTSVMRFFEDSKEDGDGNTADGGKTLILAFTSNRGLCGAFNSNIVKKVIAHAQEVGKENVEFIGVGKKGVAMLNAVGIKATQAFEKDDTATTDESVREVAAVLYERFKSGDVAQVLVASTSFHSPMLQTADLKQLYPLPLATAPEAEEETQESAGDHLYTYEPTPTAVLDFLIPRIAEVELYQALLESNASEHSARMLAMKNASEAASEMGQELKLVYNRARQAAITQEIAEIAAGSAAVS